MITEYENLVTGDSVDIEPVPDMEGEGEDFTDEAELMGACAMMGDDDILDAMDETPELLGIVLTAVLMRRRQKKIFRRKFKRKLRGMSRRKKRKMFRAWRRARRRKKIRKGFKIFRYIRFPIASAIGRAVIKRKARKAGMTPSQYMKAKRQKRRGRRTTRRLL